MTESRGVTLGGLILLELLMVLHSTQVLFHVLCVVAEVDCDPWRIQVVLLLHFDAQKLVVQFKLLGDRRKAGLLFWL